MAVYETLQLNPEIGDMSNKLDYCELILSKIANGEIESAHITKPEAIKIINFIKIYK